MMIPRCIFVVFLTLGCAVSAEPTFLSLPDSKIILSVSEGWTIKDRDGEIGMHSPDQPEKGLPNRVHLSWSKGANTTLEAAINGEIERVTERSPKWGSSNDRKSFKGSTPIRTESGLSGLRANFYEDSASGRRYSIVKYYFFDESGNIFRVCAHIYGDEAKFKEYDGIIIRGLKLSDTK